MIRCQKIPHDNNSHLTETVGEIALDGPKTLYLARKQIARQQGREAIKLDQWEHVETGFPPIA